MAVYYYDGEQKSPPNYVGIRVNVMVAGKVKQRWFSFNKEYKTKEQQKKAKEEAENLNTLWLMEKNLSKKRPEIKNGDIPVFRTGVTGIRIKFNKIVSVKNGNKWSGFTPCFDVATQKNHKRYHRQYNIKRRGYDMAWLHACQFIAEQQDVRLDEILCKKPPIEKMLIILDWQRRNGDNIETRRLPNELIQRFIEDKSEETQQILLNILTDKEKKMLEKGYSYAQILTPTRKNAKPKQKRTA